MVDTLSVVFGKLSYQTNTRVGNCYLVYLSSLDSDTGLYQAYISGFLHAYIRCTIYLSAALKSQYLVN